MSQVFADTSYFVALVNPRDSFHQQAREQTAAIDVGLVTTAWVITEVANFLSAATNRHLFLSLLHDLRSDPRITIEPSSVELFEAGLALYAQRSDKDWSLTDCVSFVVMQRSGVTEALTTDHHFEQAGFIVLLQPRSSKS